MSLIQITDLSFTYDGACEPVFDHVSFQLDTSWRLGFTGRNSRGKTTFLNLLQGKYPYQGTISASVQFSCFPYQVADPSVLAVDALEEMDPDCEFWRLLREMNGLSLPEDLLYRPYSTLSGGERTRLQLAVLFARENHFLLIDEPTNHLDLEGRRQVARYLNTKQGFILVSHDRAFLDGCVDHILSINKASIQVTRGNFTTWWENKQRQDAFEQAENAKLKREITRLEATAAQKAQWSDRVEATKIGFGPCDRGYIGHKAAKMMARSKAIETRQQAAIGEKSKLLKNIDRADTLKIFQTPYPTDRLVLARDLTIAYGPEPLFPPLNFEIRQGDRIPLSGPNGSGKSSLISLLCREPIPHTGELRMGNGLKISHVCQDSSALSGRLSDLARQRDIPESLLFAILTKLDVPKSQLERDLSSLSQGQKKKVHLALSICTPAHLHIWDEPMNYIDVLSRIQLEELLLTFQPTILFVEHDQVFRDKIATKVIELGK